MILSIPTFESVTSIFWSIYTYTYIYIWTFICMFWFAFFEDQNQIHYFNFNQCKQVLAILLSVMSLYSFHSKFTEIFYLFIIKYILKWMQIKTICKNRFKFILREYSSYWRGEENLYVMLIICGVQMNSKWFSLHLASS